MIEESLVRIPKNFVLIIHLIYIFELIGTQLEIQFLEWIQSAFHRDK